MARVSEELERRQSATADVLALLKSRPLHFFGWREFAQIAPCSWRTRIADARRIVQADGGDVVWNKSVRDSCYAYRPYTPLGRDAAEPVTQKSLF